MPALMTAGAVLLAWGSVGLDRVTSVEWLDCLSSVYSGGAEGAASRLGTFIAAFLYCLLVLRAIRRAASGAWARQLCHRLALSGRESG